MLTLAMAQLAQYGSTEVNVVRLFIINVISNNLKASYTNKNILIKNGSVYYCLIWLLV